jgi:hypothetical protein
VAPTTRSAVSVPDDRPACAALADRATNAGRFGFGVLRGRGMADTPEFVDLINRLRALLASEYRRGQADAAQRIIQAAQGEVGPSTAPPGPRRNPELPGMNGAQKYPSRRAPAGLPDELITRVLKARGHQGASSREIEEAAQSDLEKLVSQSGIRFALDRGRNVGKYRNAHGRWFLVEEARN